MFAAGVLAAFEKVAAMDQTIHEVVKPLLPANASPGDELEELLPDDGELEALVVTVEENFGIVMPSDVVFHLFAEGTVADLEKAIADQLVMQKTADHAYYMQHRAMIQQKNRQYRMRNLQLLRRKSRRYRKKIKRKQIRPRRRVGTPGGGYIFIPR